MSTRAKLMIKLVSILAITVVLGTVLPQVARSQSGRQIIIAHPGPIYTMDAPVTWFGSTHWLTMMLSTP